MATLGDLFQPDNTRLGPHDVEPTVLSLSKYKGFVRADEYFDKRIASAKLDAYKVVPDGGWAFSTIHIDEGSIARNTRGETGVISPMYTTMRWKSERDLPEFAALLVKQPSMLDEYKNRAQGSINRRRSLPFKSFAAIEILLPSKAEQRRIVDLVSSIDEQIDALQAEATAAATLLQLVARELLARMPDKRRLGDLTTTRSGASFAASDVSGEPAEGTVPVIGIPNAKPDGTLDLSGVGHVSGLSKSVGKVDESSLILIRTNGNRQRIGNVYLPQSEAHGHAVSAFQFLMKMNDPTDREFVYWVLREPGLQAAMSKAASGTTGLGNLAVGWLNSTRICWSDDRAQRESVVEVLRSHQAGVDGLRDELGALRVFRLSLLTSLLSRETTIPDSYDELMGRAS